MKTLDEMVASLTKEQREKYHILHATNETFSFLNDEVLFYETEDRELVDDELEKNYPKYKKELLKFFKEIKKI